MSPSALAPGPSRAPLRGEGGHRSDAVAADKASSSPKVRRFLRGRVIKAVISAKANQEPPPTFARTAFGERNAVERLNNRLEWWRRIAKRHEKRAANYYRAMATDAAILLWL